jgi:hypothetical protein
VPKFPWPPAAEELQAIRPAYRRLATGATIARIYPRGGRFPTTWRAFRHHGPLANARFDHHDPDRAGEQRGVLYGAQDLGTCVAEVFQETRVVDRTADDRCLAAFQLTRPVRLLNLTGDWPTRAGASQAISSGPRGRARAWARAIYDAYPSVDGLRYRSSMRRGQPAVVLFERAEDAVPDVVALDIPLSHPGLLPDLARIANELGYLLR